MTTDTTTPGAVGAPILTPGGRVRPAQRPAENSMLTLLVLLAGVFMSILDFFIVNVALPPDWP